MFNVLVARNIFLEIVWQMKMAYWFAHMHRINDNRFYPKRTCSCGQMCWYIGCLQQVFLFSSDTNLVSKRMAKTTRWSMNNRRL